MKEVKYFEYESGDKCVIEDDGAEFTGRMDIIESISKDEFTSRFPDCNGWLVDWNEVFLENGIICLDSEWNGEVYTIKKDGKETTVKPVYKENGEDDIEVVGYEIW